jgi:hypothetical protein
MPNKKLILTGMSFLIICPSEHSEESVGRCFVPQHDNYLADYLPNFAFKFSLIASKNSSVYK